jgi:hypothetical protein
MTKAERIDRTLIWSLRIAGLTLLTLLAIVLAVVVVTAVVFVVSAVR